MIKVCESKEHLNVSYLLEFRLLFNSFDSFLFHADAFWRHYIAEEPNLFLMKSTLFQVNIQQELPKLFQNPPYGCDVSIFVIINIDEDIIQIHDSKNVKLLSKNLVDIFLEAY